MVHRKARFLVSAEALLTAGLLFAGLSGCGPSPQEIADGEDPLAALAVGAKSKRYDAPFWRLQHSRRPDLFARAVAYCQREAQAGRLPERPNCEPVLLAKEFVESMNQPRPERRGYTGILEEDAREDSARAADGPRVPAPE